ncbi:response regulator [Desulfovibrio ferrophilus]|uniref:Response regulator receiver n=1 Tax=Desulfovibrio ferrophilus TaxID=241368 RepID=A0A2Z6B0W3_9BACT|nr:response regulator [Desulfovibrio ferrophilus]BBD09070.1 response regulator receiver [Desulfovibrio ferrophilus]
MCASDFHIVITDRNSHVRELLFRELLREGYRVTEAKNGAHLLEILGSSQVVHLLVLDPEFCGIRHCTRIDPGQAKVVLHALEDVDCSTLPAGISTVAACVEKTGDLDKLKRVLRNLLNETATTQEATPDLSHPKPGTDNV